jgi:serine/threonine protein phosphatase PrpC
MVPDLEIAGTLTDFPDPQTSADHLVSLANEHGGDDNVSVIVLRIDGVS